MENRNVVIFNDMSMKGMLPFIAMAAAMGGGMMGGTYGGGHTPYIPPPTEAQRKMFTQPVKLSKKQKAKLKKGK